MQSIGDETLPPLSTSGVWHCRLETTGSWIFLAANDEYEAVRPVESILFPAND